MPGGRFSSMPSGMTVSSMPPADAAALGREFRAMGAVLFGADDGGFTSKARADLAPLIEAGDILFVACDSGASEAAACSRARITMTPTLCAGSERAEGYKGLRDYATLADASSEVATGLSARGAFFFGRDSCVWTRRQKAVLGSHAEKLYVDCDDTKKGGAAKCAAANVSAVPVWSVPGLSPPPEPGFRPLGALKEWVS
jgi:hypothetical protein